LRTASIIETAEPNRSPIDDIHRKNWIALRRVASTLPSSFPLPHTGHQARMPGRGPVCHRLMSRAG
jgi:hypothetical protein